MLPRALPRAFSLPGHASSGPTAVHHAVCTCSCGALFRAHNPVTSFSPALSTSQKRYRGHRRSPRAAPSVKRQALSPEGAHKHKQAVEWDAAHLWRLIEAMRAQGTLGVEAGEAVGFLNEFAGLAGESGGRARVVDTGLFEKVRGRYELNERDMLGLSVSLLNRPDDGDKALGRTLLYTMAAAGYVEATIRILSHALLGSKAQPNLLRSSEINQARGHLRQVARQGENGRAMVLEGKIAHELGDDEYAIQTWSRAINAAIAASEEEARLVKLGRPGQERLQQMRRVRERDLSELSTPWIELTLIHYERYVALKKKGESLTASAELQKAKDACEVGCRQDDPTSHYHMAEFFKERNADGSACITSSWLYHMTKAAASGHVKAAHALAQWYAESGWKYIEDEPPDHVKPTPFDSYPAPASASTTSAWRRFLGVGATTRPDPKEELFHTAVFPSTPQDRWQLAFQWLDLAIHYTYAPSYVLAAQMLLEKTLWGQAHAPPDALALSPSRYTYATKSDYDARHPIAGRLEPHPDEPNPAYDERRAKSYLVQTLHAVQSHRQRQQLLAHGTSPRPRLRANAEIAAAGEDGKWKGDVPASVRKWWVYEDVRAMWEGEVDELQRRVSEICEEKGWDLFDEDGGLVYKSGLQKGFENRQQTASAATEVLG